jgi:hypothetical protein
MSSLPWMQEVPPTEPIEEGDEGERNTVGSPLEVVIQPHRRGALGAVGVPAPCSTGEHGAAVEEVVATGA